MRLEQERIAMGAYRDRLRAWLREGAQQNATHMLVVFDAHDNDEFPLFVHPGMSAAPLLAELTPGVQHLAYRFAYHSALDPQLDELVAARARAFAKTWPAPLTVDLHP